LEAWTPNQAAKLVKYIENEELRMENYSVGAIIWICCGEQGQKNDGL
jgi:hypothetical protein